MASLINLNQTHIVPNGLNNTLRRTFDGSVVNFKDREIAVERIQMYNSQFNVNASQYANNTFRLTFPTGATTSVLNIFMPNGYYDYTRMNAYIQKQMFAAGAYLIDASNNIVYYAQIQQNEVYYACQIDLSPVPTTLPIGWSYAKTGLYSGAGGLPTSSITPVLSVLTSGFASLTGLPIASYPPSNSSSQVSFLSTRTPQINPVSSYLIRCNLCSNPYTQPSDLLTTFTTQNTSFGTMINVAASEFSWIEVPDATRSYIEVTITDQNQNPVKFEDTQLSINILVREKMRV